MGGKPLHNDTPEEALIRHNTAVLLSIGMMLSRIAKGCGVKARRFQDFSRGAGNLTDKEIQSLLAHFKKIKKYISAMMK